MNTENDKYTELISRIKTSQPILSDPQRLTSTTMQRIELLSKKKSHNRILSIVSITSSIAASLFIGLFVFEQFLPLENSEYEHSTVSAGYILPVPNKIVYIGKSAPLSEFSNLIRTKKEQQIFYSNIINKYKTL
jgi:hypothetical protein